MFDVSPNVDLPNIYERMITIMSFDIIIIINFGQYDSIN